MEIEIFDNNLSKEDVKDAPHRYGCRGILKKDNKYLMVNLTEWDITTFPGGGIEENETQEECVVREVFEETGVRCKVKYKTVTVTEYFIDSIWTNYYFLCDFISQENGNSLTKEEKELGLIVKWMTLEEILDTFENNMTKHKHGPNVQNREFLGLINSI